MTTAATIRHSRTIAMPSTTPHGLPSRTPGSVGQTGSTGPSAKSRLPRSSRDLGSPSPNYFEFVADPASNPTDSNPWGHAKKNWSPGSGGFRAFTGTSPRAYPAEAQPRFEAFRRQSQSGTFNLSHGSLSHFSLGSGTLQSPTADDSESRPGGFVSPPNSRNVPFTNSTGKATPRNDRMEIDYSVRSPPNEASKPEEPPSFFDMPRNQSPSHASPLDSSHMEKSRFPQMKERDRPNSLPHTTADLPSPAALSSVIRRAATLPPSLADENPTMVSPQELVDIIKNHLSQDILLLDLRVFPQFSQSRIEGAINLCIPTTLLKRSSFNVQKLAETFTKEQEKEKFSRWRESKAIVVYDTSSAQLKDAMSSVNTLKKFTKEGWQGSTLVIRGGFAGFAKKCPDMVDKRPANEMEGSKSRKLALDPTMSVAAPLAGGCLMPSSKSAATPFFCNIRQNIDLIGGVGQIAVKLPSGLETRGVASLPPWLRLTSDERDKGKTVAEQFLGIEKAEQLRMQKALTSNVCYGTPDPTAVENIQIAGIEKGAKNRYKDMLPYDHSRVRLQNVPLGGCDYVNASHIKSKWSHRQYIATQAPVPATFQDFWRVVWEQDARVIVMLTAESEGGQRKCHPYWLPSEYGPFKLKLLSERKLSIETPKRASTNGFTPPNQRPGALRPGIDRRRSTNNGSLLDSHVTYDPPAPSTPDYETPHLIVRKLALSHAMHPFEPMREITQLQYSSWPDFGTPAHAAHVLGLVEHCGAIVNSYDNGKGKGKGNGRSGTEAPAKKDDRPIVVHCSAGCGRTGTFCTVDSVVDMLKRQRFSKVGLSKEFDDDDDDVEEPVKMDLDNNDKGANHEGLEQFPTDEVDLVAETVKDFRLQRLSMVQTLRQFVLCYESVLEWLVKQSPDKALVDAAAARKSYHA